MEVGVLERISSREQAVARLWDIYQAAPPVDTYNVPLTLRWNVGAALIRWKDKRGVDILLECLTAKDLAGAEDSSARHNRHSGFIWFVVAIGNPCGDDVSGVRWSADLDGKAIPRLAAWWKAHRETWQFKDTKPNGAPEVDQRSE